jgi:hypothetical protein
MSFHSEHNSPFISMYFHIDSSRFVLIGAVLRSQGKLLVREDSSGHNPPDDQSDKSISSMPSYFYGRY